MTNVPDTAKMASRQQRQECLRAELHKISQSDRIPERNWSRTTPKNFYFHCSWLATKPGFPGYAQTGTNGAPTRLASQSCGKAHALWITSFGVKFHQLLELDGVKERKEHAEQCPRSSSLSFGRFASWTSHTHTGRETSTWVANWLTAIRWWLFGQRPLPSPIRETGGCRNNTQSSSGQSRQLVQTDKNKRRKEGLLWQHIS